MRILIADKFQSSGIDALNDAGCEVTVDPDQTPETLPDTVVKHDPEVLIVRSTKVPKPVFDRGKSIALVVRAGAGYDTIDVPAASANGVFVANCPGKNSVAVAELTWALILGCDRLVPQQTNELAQGRWNKKKYSKALGLMGRTLGVIGCGQIGREVIHRAHAFGMPVVAWSRSLDDKQAKLLNIERLDSPSHVARRADVVSLHVAANNETEHLVDRDFLSHMKEGATLINTTRGSVVDEAALLEAMRDKNLRVGLDVFADEPGSAETVSSIAIAREPTFVGTHHIGASTEQAQEAIAEEAVRIVLTYRQSGHVENVVNRAAKSRAKRLLVVRHMNRPGVLAHVIGAIGKAGINIEEMENVILESGEAACARVRLDDEPDAQTLETIRSKAHEIISADMGVIQ